MVVTLGEDPYHTRLLLKDIGGLACRCLPKSLSKNAINDRGMPRTFINWEGASTLFLAHGLLPIRDWI